MTTVLALEEVENFYEMLWIRIYKAKRYRNLRTLNPIA
jgi:hypothetical protein